MEPILIPAGNPGPYTGVSGNNTWLLDGAVPTLIDAGTGQPSHIDAIRDALGGRPLARVLVTHGHSDHASGLPALRAAWPDVEALKFPNAGESGWLPLVDGEVVPAGGGTLGVVYTPGHAVDHVCFWDEASGGLFAGDMVIRPGSVLIPAGRGGKLRAYLASLERLAALKPRRIFPGHGPVVDTPLRVIAEYQRHRQRREEQILALLAEGLTEAEAITDRLYAGIAPDLRRGAAMTVEAHLEKLREEGRLP